jgi:hypothetical protein
MKTIQEEKNKNPHKKTKHLDQPDDESVKRGKDEDSEIVEEINTSHDKF